MTDLDHLERQLARLHRSTPKKLGTLEVVFDWIEKNETRAPSLTGDLLHELRELGYCACTTEFGCVVCGGTKTAATEPSGKDGA